ncbi:MAG TPA: TonB-dependent receptor [Bryobacteraceae bacterium]|nr:TonB-dependent receptor [Bryobacteraceae bacterium]
MTSIQDRQSQRFPLYLGLLAAVFLGQDNLLAQAGRSEIFGTVVDPSGLPVSAATVELEDQRSSSKRSILTSSDGSWQFFAVVPGRYRVVAGKVGFRTLVRESVQVSVSDQVPIHLTLELGNVEEAVNVLAEAPVLQSTTGAVSFLVDQQKVVNLPLDGRNFVPLIALLPGVALPPGQVLPRINGSRPRVSEYLYDGISVLQPEPGQVAYYPIIDAIEEFRVQTNSYSAEYGRSNGGVIQDATRSGGDQYHGTLFEFFRNEAFNARNLFSTTGPKPRFRRNQYGGVLGGPLQKRRTFFFVAWQGTRLQTGLTRVSTVPTTTQREGRFATPVFDPASTRLAGDGWVRDPFPGNAIPPTRWDPVSARLLSRFPLPNVMTPSGAEATANNYRRTADESTEGDQLDFRVDRLFGSSHRLFGRYSLLRDDSRPATPLPDGSGRLASGIIGHTLTRGDSAVLEHAWTLTPRSVNQVRFGFTRRGLRRSALDAGKMEAGGVGIPSAPLSSFPGVLPSFDIVGLQQLGPSSSSNARFTTSVTQFIDNYSVLVGQHSLKIGTDLRWERLDVLQPPSPTGNYQFDNVLTSGLSSAGTPIGNTGHPIASFLLGSVQSFSIDAQQEVLKPRAAISEFFLQDDWRSSRRLTLNLGLRYTINWPSVEANNRSAIFNLDTQKLDFLGRNGYPRAARELEPFNLAPRLGFAFKLSDTSVLRGGYGITWIEQAGITTPFTTPLFPFIQSLGQRSLDNREAAFRLSEGPTVRLSEPSPESGLGQGVFGLQRDNGSGYAQQWNLMVQKAFGSVWSFEAGYLGSKLTRLGVPDTNLNQLRVEQLALGGQLTQQVPNPFHGEVPLTSAIGSPTVALQQLLRPFPRFTTVTLYRNNVGHSTYHSFQTRLERRFWRGLTATASYTFSKLIDDAGAVFDSAVLTGPVVNYQAADSFNRRLEKDESTGSAPHVFSSGWVWELPFGSGRRVPLSGWKNHLAGGWRIAGIVRLQSGMLVPVTQATNLNAAFGFGVQRPNRIASPNSYPERSVSRWFNTAAFTPAPQFTIGNSSRNPVRGPGYQAADLMAGKTIAVNERWQAELRAEVFNLTNTPPLGQPNGSLGTAAFGSITTALDPRVFELVLKLHF